MPLLLRRIALGTTLTVVAAAGIAIAAPQAAFAADAGDWATLQSEFGSAAPGTTITLTADITGTPGQNIGVPAGGDVTLDLNGHLLDIDASSSSSLAGIRVVPGMSLTITDTSRGGAGHLIARGGAGGNGGTGIGGNGAEPGGTVTIRGGTVDAYGGNQAAGIGGANYAGGSVTISGGTVNAVGGSTAAGIGGGWTGGGGPVTISGGIVTATGGFEGAGIGGGFAGSGGAVSIRGGVVTARAGVAGTPAAVGGGAGGGPGTLDVYAAPFGSDGDGGGSAPTPPAVTPHPTGGVRYLVTTSATEFHLQFGQVLSFATAPGSAVADEFVTQGSTPTTPAPAPSYADHVLIGWFTSAAAVTPFDFAAPLAADATAYAKWVVAHNAVSFDLGGHGAAVTSQVVDYGHTATEPATPTAAGYTFGGWYTDAARTVGYDFATPVTAPTTLYAKWTAVSHAVTFDPADGKAVTTARVSYRATVSEPPTPTRDGYTFTGWYTNAAATAKYDFAAPVVGNLHLYAGWQAAAATPAPSGGSDLANTGADIPGLVGVALLLLLAGGAALVIGERRKVRGS